MRYSLTYQKMVTFWTYADESGTTLSPVVHVLLTVPRRYFFVDLLCFSVLCLLCICARLFICALWSPAGKRLISWLSFVVYNCEFVTFPLVSWVKCGT